LERLSEQNPLGGEPGIVMPFALNTHIPPVIYEVLQAGTLLVENDPKARRTFVQEAEARLDAQRSGMLEEAREAILQVRNLGAALASGDGVVLPQPPKYLDPIRVGWRLARVLGSVPVLDQATRDPERTSQDVERLGQAVGWFSNAVGAVTGIGKAMLSMFGMPRPPRRWQIFFPLADANLMTVEHALQLGAAVELRWSLITGGMIAAERVTSGVRTALAPVLSFARLAAWYSEVPGGRTDQRVH